MPSDASLSTASKPAVGSERLTSLDAYRGFVMVAMVSGGLALTDLAEHYPESPAWQQLAYQLEHVPWVGCAAWDLIQPSFMFIVGVALPYSVAARAARGQSPAIRWAHVLWRSAVLVLLGIFLRSNGRESTNFTFEDVITQIGLGYPLVYALAVRGWRWQLAGLAAVLAGYWVLFAAWPLVPADFNAAQAGWPDDWNQLSGFAAHWNKHVNPAGYFDRWFLNLFPRSEPFEANGGGYQTLSFIPSMATTLLGALAGTWLRTPRPLVTRIGGLALAGLLLLALGMACDGGMWPGAGWEWSLCPVVKRIWTPSWAVFSAGWTLLLLALFVAVVDGAGWKQAALPFTVVGMNSIAIYVMSWLLRPWIEATLQTHLGRSFFDYAWGPTCQATIVLAILWLICFWLHRRKLYFRV